jgi:hypothetical protein
MQIGRSAEVPGVSNIRRYMTRSLRPFSMRSGNCAAKDRLRFPCDPARLPGPRSLVAKRAGILLFHERVYGTSRTDNACQRAHITHGLGVNNRNVWSAVETRVAAGKFELHAALYFLSALVTQMRKQVNRRRIRLRRDAKFLTYFVRFSFDEDVHGFSGKETNTAHGIDRCDSAGKKENWLSSLHDLLIRAVGRLPNPTWESFRLSRKASICLGHTGALASDLERLCVCKSRMQMCCTTNYPQ